MLETKVINSHRGILELAGVRLTVEDHLHILNALLSLIHYKSQDYSDALE